MTPWEGLADHWRSLGAELQVYDTITDQLDVPCLVILPGSPWIENGAPGASSQTDQERYNVYTVAGSASPSSAQRQMHKMIHLVINNLPDGWDWASTGRPGALSHQNINYLAAEIQLTFRDCTEGDPYAEPATPIESGASSS